MFDAQTAVANTNVRPAFRKPSGLLTFGLVLLPFAFAWLLLRKGYSPTARVLAFAWTILYSSLLLALPNAPQTGPGNMQAATTGEAVEDGQPISRAGFEARGLTWPLTVDEAGVGCDRGLLLWVAVDGERYGLNGSAVEFGYPSIRPIWSDNPTSEPNGGPKIGIQDLFEAAQATCSTSN